MQFFACREYSRIPLGQGCTAAERYWCFGLNPYMQLARLAEGVLEANKWLCMALLLGAYAGLK